MADYPTSSTKKDIEEKQRREALSSLGTDIFHYIEKRDIFTLLRECDFFISDIDTAILLAYSTNEVAQLVLDNIYIEKGRSIKQRIKEIESLGSDYLDQESEKHLREEMLKHLHNLLHRLIDSGVISYKGGADINSLFDKNGNVIPHDMLDTHVTSYGESDICLSLPSGLPTFSPNIHSIPHFNILDCASLVDIINNLSDICRQTRKNSIVYINHLIDKLDPLTRLCVHHTYCIHHSYIRRKSDTAIVKHEIKHAINDSLQEELQLISQIFSGILGIASGDKPSRIWEAVFRNESLTIFCDILETYKSSGLEAVIAKRSQELDTLICLSTLAKKEGLLGLEVISEDTSRYFSDKTNHIWYLGLNLLVDGTEPEVIEDTLKIILNSTKIRYEILENFLYQFYIALLEGENPRNLATKLCTYIPDNSAFKETINLINGNIDYNLPLEKKDYFNAIKNNQGIDDFEALTALPKESIQLILRETSCETIYRALCCCSPILAKTILENMSERAAHMLLEDIREHSPNLQDIISSQEEIVRVYNRLKEQGDIP